MDMLFSLRHWALIAAVVAVGAARAAPYLPASADTIVEQLPAVLSGPQAELQALRRRLAQQPDSLLLASELAQRYIDQARGEGDPRFLGYAQAVLQPWWGEQAPVAARVLRATIRQSNHQFDAALEDLNQVLRLDRRNLQAWLTRATILQVQGRFQAARGSCEHLYGLGAALVAQTCTASVGASSGSLAASYAALAQALAQSPGAGAATRSWIETLLAEMAVRKGDAGAAQRHYRAALTLDPDDAYLLGSYADFLLARGDGASVARLLRDKTRNDSLLLRYALALQQSDAAAAAELVRVLDARFAAAAARRDTLHQREQARYALHLKHDAAAALVLARSNWQVQREPADLRILAEACVAARDRVSARVLLDWLAQNHMEDATLVPVLNRLKELA